MGSDISTWYILLLYEINNFLKTAEDRDVPVGVKKYTYLRAQSLNWFPRATVTHDVHEKKAESHPTPPDGFLPKAAAPEVTNRAGAGIPPNQLESPTDDFTKDGLIPKPGSDSLGGGTKNCRGSAGDPKGPAMSSPGAVPNTLQISPAVAKKINDEIKYQLMKEVQKFGRSK